jgi:UDP-N-acetylglucosamine enolpyruvyl transferase
MGTFVIEGGNPLNGEIVPQGAKNEALQVLCAVMLTSEPVVISNLPDIVDVNKLIELLGDLGVKVEKLEAGTFRFEANNIDVDFLEGDVYRKKGGGLRGSVMLIWQGIHPQAWRRQNRPPPYGHPFHGLSKPRGKLQLRREGNVFPGDL